MGVQVTVVVKLPSGKPVAGAQIHGLNHDAWSEKHRDWKGTTDIDGRFTWSNLDKGTLGDRYTFSVTSPDVSGEKWIGEVSQRITGPVEVVVVLHKKGEGE